MSIDPIQLVLLPGMDGTGDLFAGFLSSLPIGISASVVPYPADGKQSSEDLLDAIESSVPASAPFVLVAESFSAPLAMQWAATGRANLKGVVICAGFASSPVRGWLRHLCLLLSPICFLIPPPAILIRGFLVGIGAPNDLVAAVRAAIGSVNPKTLTHRLRLTLTADARSALSNVKTPILFIQPTRDRLVGPACLKEMQAIRPDSTLELISGPHLLLQARPRETADVVARFARRLSR